MTEPVESDRARLEAQHPIVRNAGRKGLASGAVAVLVVAVIALGIWSFSPFGLAYSIVPAIPYVIAIGAILLLVRAVRLRRRRPEESDRATSATTTPRDR